MPGVPARELAEAGDRRRRDRWALALVATAAAVVVARVVEGGPGPSIIDLPKVGCWHLTLQWAGRTDTLDLAWAAP